MARPGGPTVRRMPEFLAETYTPRLAAAPSAAGLARAAAQVSGHGAPVCFLAAINVPAEETCFYLYQAPHRRRGPRGDDRRPAAARADHPGRLNPATRSRPRHREPAGRHAVT